MHFHRSTFLASFAILFCFQSLQCIASGERAYVTNEAGDSVTVVDTVAAKVLETFPVGRRPRGAALISRGRELLVAVSGSPRQGPGADPERAKKFRPDRSADGIVVVDTSTHAVLRKIDVGSDPEAFAVSVDEKTVFVANEDAASLSAWDIATGVNKWVCRVGDEPEGVAVRPNSQEVWVGSEEEGALFVVSSATGQLIGKIPVGKRPRTLIFSQDGAELYTALEGEAALARVSAKDRRLLSKIKIGESDSLPMGVCAAPKGDTVYVSTGRGGKVARVDLKTEKVGLLQVGERPWGIALSADGARLFTANGPSNDLSIVDLDQWKEVGRVQVGARPWGVTVEVTAK